VFYHSLLHWHHLIFVDLSDTAGMTLERILKSPTSLRKKVGEIH